MRPIGSRGRYILIMSHTETVGLKTRRYVSVIVLLRDRRIAWSAPELSVYTVYGNL